MKRLSFLLVAFALVAFVSLNACKSSTDKTPEVTPEEEVIEEPAEVVEEQADTTAVVEMEAEEAVAEEATE